MASQPLESTRGGRMAYTSEALVLSPIGIGLHDLEYIHCFGIHNGVERLSH